jgi:hypothetical protein
MQSHAFATAFCIPQPVHAFGPKSAFGTVAYACAECTLYATASACNDVSSMPVEGTLTLVRLGSQVEDVIVSDVPTHGFLLAYGVVLSSATMGLDFDRGSIELSANGKTFELASFSADGLGPELLSVSFST